MKYFSTVQKKKKIDCQDPRITKFRVYVTVGMKTNNKNNFFRKRKKRDFDRKHFTLYKTTFEQAKRSTSCSASVDIKPIASNQKHQTKSIKPTASNQQHQLSSIN